MIENVFKRSDCILPWLHLVAVRFQKYLSACAQGFLEAYRYKRCGSISAKKCCQGVFLVFVLSLASCQTSKHLEVVEHTIHDTLIHKQLHYDSIYINHEKIYEPLDSTTANLPPFKGGPGRVLEVTTEYRYRLLRDTTYVHRIDTIPVIKTVEVTKEVRYIPPWLKSLACIGAITILLILLSIILKLVLR